MKVGGGRAVFNQCRERMLNDDGGATIRYNDEVIGLRRGGVISLTKVRGW